MASQFVCFITVAQILVSSIPRILLAVPPSVEFEVPVEQTLQDLENDEDTDGDKKITVKDAPVPNTSRGDRTFQFRSVYGELIEVSGIYHLSNLLQELALAHERGNATVILDGRKIFEKPLDRISRAIRERHWDGLVRTIDEEGLVKSLSDPKASGSKTNYLYVPHDDPAPFEYFQKVARANPKLHLVVEQLPRNPSAKYLSELTAQGKHGLLSLGLQSTPNGKISGLPFVVPGGRFNEMYGWDSYFESLGLLQDGQVELAKAMVDNFVYEITHYGKILNANRTYYLLRSQPPFLTSMALAVYEKLPRNDKMQREQAKEWLRTVLLAAVREYENVWMGEDRLTKTGLSRYFGIGFGVPPEVEPGHFDPIFKPFAEQLEMDVKTFEQLYKDGKINEPKLDRFFLLHDPAERESGHDTTYRFDHRCGDFVTVDLNSLLYKIELNLARAIDSEFGGTLSGASGENAKSSTWHQRASKRLQLMNKYLWDPERGMFFDYDVANDRRSNYVSATTFYPLWAGAASPEQAEQVLRNALPLLEVPGGLVATAESSRGALNADRPARQWDYPYGWAPHQMLAWQGLRTYGYDADAQRLIYRWLYTITRNAVDYNGIIPEKFDVVKRSHDVYAEYGQEGDKFNYITKEGFGWMNASFEVGISLLPADLQDSLNALIPPEWIFKSLSF